MLIELTVLGLYDHRHRPRSVDPGEVYLSKLEDPEPRMISLSNLYSILPGGQFDADEIILTDGGTQKRSHSSDEDEDRFGFSCGAVLEDSSGATYVVESYDEIRRALAAHDRTLIRVEPAPKVPAPKVPAPKVPAPTLPAVDSSKVIVVVEADVPGWAESGPYPVAIPLWADGKPDIRNFTTAQHVLAAAGIVPDPRLRPVARLAAQMLAQALVEAKLAVGWRIEGQRRTSTSRDTP